jgi:hypothetical protein
MMDTNCSAVAVVPDTFRRYDGVLAVLPITVSGSRQ